MLDMLDAGPHGPAAVEAAVVTLIITASGIAPFGVVAPFWGVLAGAAAYLLLTVARGIRRGRAVAAQAATEKAQASGVCP